MKELSKKICVGREIDRYTIAKITEGNIELYDEANYYYLPIYLMSKHTITELKQAIKKYIENK